MLNKILIRKELRAKRHAIPADIRARAALAGAKLLTEQALFQNSQHIAVYLARDDEFDTQPIIEEIWQAKKQVYLPAMLLEQERKLNFVLFNKNDELQANRLHILESKNTTMIPSIQLDLVLLPLVGFDLAGHRLGLGGGYYDRTFTYLREDASAKPFLIGIAYEDQCVQALPHDHWDVPLNAILTEKQFIIF